jgi:superfamily II DNA or RNA helicase
VQARVRGSLNYEVSLYWENGELLGSCDCPYCFSEGACKHLWATILAAEAKGYLSAAASATELILDTGEHDSDEDLDYEEFSDEEEDEEYDRYARLRRPAAFAKPAIPPPPARKSPPPKTPAWRTQIETLSLLPVQTFVSGRVWPARRQIIYIVDVPASVSTATLVVSITYRDPKADGGWTQHYAINIKRADISQLPVAEDREILSALAGAGEYTSWGAYDTYASVPSVCRVPPALAGMVLQTATRAGRCYLQCKSPSGELAALAWEDGAWQFGLEMRRRDKKKEWEVAGFLRRGDERMDLAAAALVVQGGLVFTNDRVAPLAEDAPFEWMSWLRKNGGIRAPETDGEALLAALLQSPNLPALEAPEELRFEEVTLQPKPCLHIRSADPKLRKPARLRAELSFDYDGRLAPAFDRRRGLYDPANRRLLRRDFEAEKAAAEVLLQTGVRFQAATYSQSEPGWVIAPTKLPRVVRALVEKGWNIEADGKVFRCPGAFRIEVATGVDWFELRGGVEYGDGPEIAARLPELLEALRHGDNMVRLGDGTYGMLPEEWLRRFGPLAGLGSVESDHIRFRPSQAGLLDALLATQPEARCDEVFTRVRQELRRFQGVEAAEQPAGFVGQLRDYQREGLGWMEFLRRFSFGGCLADDMGVGKTAQVLALLETRREQRVAGENIGPSLVVVPKSLVFNWKQEAARFTPRLKMLDYTGLARNGQDFTAYDAVITTYGTLRRDALRLKDVAFDYVVLDESQAVKNAGTESSKAVRLLRGAHRLALSGTPVENHLGELWTLFEFLNPGMLGAAAVFKKAGGTTRSADEETRRILAQAVRPFILRRTKEQVARELPPKTEQTIYCEMEPPQRRLYNELRQHYRNALLKRVETDGLAKAKIQVLEALLRLRQAACHPGLIDEKRRSEASAKLDELLARLREVLDEGHKALVFSQFTSLLALVRDRLDGGEVVYEYLDGSTRDRQARVERFQADPDCQVFLMSLKAGGLGLNLTAAEYVFLLDPWWNPAAEAQAVDRAHRIGQTRQVFAYRLIASDTVEEKVLELQKSKRDLAAAIIGDDNSLIRNLRREDLELLLS